MMFNPRRFFRRAVALPESVTTSYEKLPLFENVEKDEHAVGYISSPPEKSWIKCWKLPFVVRLLFLAFAFAFAFFSGKIVINSVSRGYDVFLDRIMAKIHVICNHETTLDKG